MGNPDPEARHRVLASARRVDRAADRLTAAALARMTEELGWFRELPAEHRSWVGLVAKNGVHAFVRWLRAPDTVDVTAPVFGAAPRELTRVVTLQQVVELVRLTVDTVEQRIDELAAPGEAGALTEAVLRFSREVAFGAARVYASAAEERGAWHARLRALLVDAVLRDADPESTHAQAAALGWPGPPEVAVVAVVVGGPPPGEPEAVLDDAERRCRIAGLDAVAGMHADRLVVVAGAADRLADRIAAALPAWGPGPVVVGDPVADIGLAARSARSALSGLRVAAAWPEAPRPVAAGALLLERVLDGDPDARRALVRDVYQPLARARGALLATVEAHLGAGQSLNATARALGVHANTVRYRLRKVGAVTGADPADPRGAFLLRTALALGRLPPPP